MFPSRSLFLCAFLSFFSLLAFHFFISLPSLPLAAENSSSPYLFLPLLTSLPPTYLFVLLSSFLLSLYLYLLISFLPSFFLPLFPHLFYFLSHLHSKPLSLLRLFPYFIFLFLPPLLPISPSLHTSVSAPSFSLLLSYSLSHSPSFHPSFISFLSNTSGRREKG